MIILDLFICLFLLIGSFFMLIGSIGLYRLPDFFTRLHGPTQATTLGIGSLLIASMMYFATYGTFSLRELLIVFFLCATAPVSAHMLSKAGTQQKLPVIDKTLGKQWDDDI